MKLGKAETLINSRRTTTALYDALGIIVEIPTAKKWKPIRQAIADASEIIETSTEAEETLAWLHAFVSRSALRGSDQSYLSECLPTIDYNDKSKLFDALRLIRSSANTSEIDSKYSLKGFFDNEARCYLQITALARFINFGSLSTERMTEASPCKSGLARIVP